MAAALTNPDEQVKLDLLYNVTTKVPVTVVRELIIKECRVPPKRTGLYAVGAKREGNLNGLVSGGTSQSGSQ